MSARRPSKPSTGMPTAFAEYDWLELVAFAQKVDREGYGYAIDNYPPHFRDPEMQAVAADPNQLRALHDAQAPAIDDWWRIEGANGPDLINAHNSRRGTPA